MATTLKNCRNSFIIAALSMLLFADATAQSTNQPFIVALTGGPSFPIGKFGDKSSTNWNTATDKTGAAGAGWSGSLQLGYQLNTHFGIAVTAGISQYKRDEEAFKKYFEDIYGNTAEVNTKDWNVVKVLAGPTYTAAIINKKLLFRSGISAGIAKTAIPAFAYAVSGSGGLTFTAGTNSKVKMPAAFAYQLNAGLGYKLDQTLLLLFDIHYFDATATNKYTPFAGGPIIGPTPQPPSTQVKEKYKLSAFSASLGIGFRF